LQIAKSRGMATIPESVVEFENGPVAQLDRASDFGSEGWGFDSLRGRHCSSLQITCLRPLSVSVTEPRLPDPLPFVFR
jgi:hypothetical protein